MVHGIRATIGVFDMTYDIEKMLDMDEKPMLTDFEISDIADLAELLFETRKTSERGITITIPDEKRIPLSLVIVTGLQSLIEKEE